MAGFIDDMLGALTGKSSSNQSADYKKGYDACEVKYAKLKDERDRAVLALKKAGYELGEEPSILKDAAKVKRQCRSMGSCEGCELNCGGSCALSGSSPSEWKVM